MEERLDRSRDELRWSRSGYGCTNNEREVRHALC